MLLRVIYVCIISSYSSKAYIVLPTLNKFSVKLLPWLYRKFIIHVNHYDFESRKGVATLLMFLVIIDKYMSNFIFSETTFFYYKQTMIAYIAKICAILYIKVL